MASYNGKELSGKGTPIEELEAGVEYVFTITTPTTLLGSAYFTFETVRNANGFYGSITPQNAVGTFSSSSILSTPIQSPYIFSQIISPGDNTFSFTPTNNVAVSSSFLRGTGGISLLIEPSTPSTPGRETGAERHYLLGDDNTGYLDIDGTNALALLGINHSTEVGYAETFAQGFPSANMNGLQTDVADKSTEQTVIIVGQMYTNFPDSPNPLPPGAIIMGNLTTSGTNGGIAVIEQQASSADAGRLFINSRGTGTFNYIETPTADNWFFLAYSLSTNNRKVFFQDATMATPTIIDQTATITVSSPTRGIGFGNVSYDNSNYNNGMKIAEGIIFDSSKTDAELADIRTRSISRLAARGVTLGPNPNIENTYIIVLAGESTAVGRSNEKTVPPDTTDPRIKQLGRLSPNNNVAILADDPLEHNDTAQASNSIGYGMSYARALLPNIGANDEILLVPVGQGGSGFYDNSWNKGDSEYNDAVSRANTALSLAPNNSVLIWVTALGINDGFHTDATSYESQFDAYDYNIRQDVTGNNYEMLHMILGCIPAVQNRSAGELAAHNINVDAPNRLENVVYVQWDDGLPISVSDIHSDGASNRTMGARLYTSQAAFTPTPQPIPDVPSNLTVTPQDSEALVTWDLVSNADSYVLEYKLDTDSTFTEVLTTSISNTVTGLTNGSLYNFRVKSRNTQGDSAYTSEVDGTPVANLIREVGAEIHHLFGTDYATFEDIQGGRALTQAGANVVNNTGHTLTGNIFASLIPTGLVSGVSHDTTGKTVIAVVQLVSSSNGAVLFGNVETSGAAGGFGIFEVGDDIAILSRGNSNVTLKTSADYNDYIFIAMSMDGTNHLGYYNDSIGGKSTASFTGAIDASSNDIGVGNTSYLNQSFGIGTRIAEFMIFDSAKTEAELDDIKARSTTRLAARGITV